MTTLEILQGAKAATVALSMLSTEQKNNALLAMADALEAAIRRDFFKLMSSQSQVAARAAGRAVDVSADDFDDAD